MDQFFKSIHYIEGHLSDDLTVRQVAQAACYSDFHFSRMFTALVGEPLVAYVRKRRLTIAAQRTLDEDVRLIEVALDSRFDSQEAFTRAFKKMFSTTPGEFRKRRGPIQFSYRSPFTRDTLLHLKEGVTMEPQIIDDEGFMVIGISEKFDQESSVGIPALWERFGPQIDTIPNMAGRRSFGICDPSDEVSGEESFVYTVAVEVDSIEDVPPGMVGKQIPHQQYAVFTHKVNPENMQQGLRATLHYIWGTWLPGSQFVSIKASDFEMYDERFDPAKMEGEFDIYIPVVAKK